MSEISISPRRHIDWQRLWTGARGFGHGIVAVTTATARITWAVLKSLGTLAFLLGITAGGAFLLWKQGGTLTGDDASVQRQIIEEAARHSDCWQPRSVDGERFGALMLYTFGALILLGGGGGVFVWCGETWNALFRRRNGNAAS